MLNKLTALFAGIAALTFVSGPAIADITASMDDSDTSVLNLCLGSAAVIDNDFAVALGQQNGPIALENGQTLTITVPVEWTLSDQVDQECFDLSLAIFGPQTLTVNDVNVLALDANNVNLSLISAPNAPIVIDTIDGSETLTYTFEVSGLQNEIIYVEETLQINVNGTLTIPTQDVILNGVN